MSQFLRFCTYHICLKSSLNMLAQLSSGAIHLNFGLSLHLHPYFICASRGSGEPVQAHLSLYCWYMLLVSKFHELSHMGLDTRKPVFGVYKQHPRRLISTFLIGFLERIISKLATGKIPNY